MKNIMGNRHRQQVHYLGIIYRVAYLHAALGAIFSYTYIHIRNHLLDYNLRVSLQKHH